MKKKAKSVSKSSKSPEIELSAYLPFLDQIRQEIRNAQFRAGLSVNSELITLYWSIGNSIIEKQNKQGWGTKIITRLAKDLSSDFPGLSGFSPRNLGYMKKFAEVYPDLQIVQAVLAKLPWWHNLLLLEKLKNIEERIWYANQVIANGWSGRALGESIKSNLYKRQGKAISNFQERLPSPQSKLAHDILKSPYNFGFLSLTNDYIERELEQGLIDNIQELLLEFGEGFAFVGKQYHLEIAGDDYYCDLLFYHLKLRCFLCCELKCTAFKPEYAGKLNFYLAAIDDQLKHPTDNPSIGMIICRTKNDLKVEYALKRTVMPIGVSEYKVKIVDSLPKELKGTLPTAAEIEAKLIEHERDEEASD